MKNGRVVHCMKEPYDVYIGRGLCPRTGKRSAWGNPFTGGTRQQNIERYRAYILKRPDLLAALKKLDGKVLGCWCKPKPCHGDMLLELIEERKRMAENK